MSIKDRLRKLEDRFGIPGGGDHYCDCPGGFLIKPAMPDEWPDTIAERPEARGCAACGKPFGGADACAVEVIMPGIDFTRAEFEKWQSEHVMAGRQTYEEYLAGGRSR